MLVFQSIKVKWHNSNREWYESKGYKFTGYRKEFEVLADDLSINSNIKVIVRCDYCDELIEKTFQKYNKQREQNSKDCCLGCKSIKTRESNLSNYGVENVFQLDEVKEKSICTNLSKYGVEHPMKTDEVKDKLKAVFIDKYGVENPFQSEFIKGKIKSTLIDKYGYEHPMQIPFVKEKAKDKNSYSFEDVKVYVEENSDCQLISYAYENSTRPMDFLCSCGNIFTNSFSMFKHEHKRQCNDCGWLLLSGGNSPRWKGGITSENDRLRHSREYREWRKLVFERDNFTCQCCGDNKGGNLQAHHIVNWSSDKDLRFDADNGIALCDSCHDPRIKGSFHYVYGTTNNTKEQLDEYIKRICKG